MNLHRYKASVSLRGTSDRNFEVAGTWIGFAGMITFIGHASLAYSVKDATFFASLYIAFLFLCHWAAQKHQYIAGVYTVLLMCGSMVALQRNAVALTNCQALSTERYIESCQNNSIAAIFYGFFSLSLALIYFIYIIKPNRQAV